MPHVIGINAEDKILDLAARCFSRRLYQALFNQDEVGNSFLSARDAVKLNDKLKRLFNSQTFQQGVNFDEAFKYILLPQVAHNQSLRIEPANARQIIYPQWSNTNIASDAPNFVGREVEIYQIIKVLVESDKRCIALHGMGGIGKTDLAKAIGRWLQERERFQDGVWLISLRDTTSVDNLIVQIKEILELESFALVQELRNSRLLLILDDLDGLINNDFDELIEQLNLLLEQCSNLRLLLTARDSLAPDLLYCHQTEVSSMGASETRQIFTKYAPSKDFWGNDENLEEDFKRLVEFLDGYPLPIRLAASYMVQSQFTIRELCEDLDIEPLEILASYTSRERKEKSLRVTLERSFARLSVQGQDIFPLLAFFPSGLSRDLAKAIWQRKGDRALRELFKFSMAEKSTSALDWRVTLPEPARAYAESKVQQNRGIDYLAPQVLDYYYTQFCDRILQLFDGGKNKQGQQFLLQENSNLVLFLQWGYGKEKSVDGICRSARITAALSSYWRWIEPNQDPLNRLDLALAAAQNHRDREGENLVTKAISTLSARGEFKDVQTLSKESGELKFFNFQVVTVDVNGEEINRESKKAQYYTEILGDNLTLEMVDIPGGSFLMGSAEEELESHNSERPQHQVTVSNFYMGRYPITQGQWQAVAALQPVAREIDSDPSHFKEDYEGIDRWQRPVERVSWKDAQEFCARLSQKTGRKYRLPTESEWEYACRAGTDKVFHFGATISTKLANFNDSTYTIGNEGKYRRQTTPVGYLQVANNFGLSDMHGNVWEWCEDNWHENYENAPNDGRAWLTRDNSIKVIRGGSWDFNPFDCRSAIRYSSTRENRLFNVGFRVVCVVPRTT